jgi:hypothetical protein
MSAEISFTVIINNPGTIISLPLTNVTSVDINWGNGQIVPYNSDYPTFTYNSTGTFIIELTNSNFISINNQNNPSSTGFNTTLSNFSYNRQINSLTSFSLAFYNVETNFSVNFALDVTNNVKSMDEMFYNCFLFNDSLSNLNTVACTKFNRMMEACSSFNQTVSFDLRAATTSEKMFIGCTNLNSPVNLINTNLITNLSEMFRFCSSFNKPISMDLSSATTLFGMFAGCTILNSPINF